MSAPRRFVLAADPHGDMADPPTVAALFDFIADWKPEIRIHMGDNWDFRNLRKGASDDEKAESLAEDWDAGDRFIRRFFDGGKERIFLRGNHDERLYDFTRSATGILRDYANDGAKRLESIIRACRAKMLPYDSAAGIYHLGRLLVIHGFFCGVYACRQHANTYGNCAFGHVHTDESAPVPSLKAASADSIPCLCRRDLDYANKKTGKLRWAQGWGYGLLFDDGRYTLNKCRKIAGKFYAATAFKSY